MLKVFIITEGGKGIGTGHITRCNSLYEAFKKKGISSEFIVDGDDAIENLLSGKRHQIFNWLGEQDRLYKAVEDASIAVIDSYLAEANFYKKISEVVEVPVYIDDNKRLDYPRGFIVNGTIYAEELDYPKREGTTYLIGNRYIPLRREFWDADEKEVKRTVESIMVTFGGDDRTGMTPKILNFLKRGHSTYRKNVIIGGAFKKENLEETEGLKDENTTIFRNPDANGMKDIMLKSDIAISAGGQTLYELARIGVPTIGVCIADNQEHNLEGWRKKGFIEYAGWYKDENLFQKISEILKMLNYEKRKTMSMIGRRFVDGQGAKRVAEAILTNYVNLSEKDVER